MQDLTPLVAAILRKYMSDPAMRISGTTTLADLGIDVLDLPMIFLDVEDACDVAIGHDDEIDGFTTVASLAAYVASRLEKQALEPRRRTTVPRSKGNWISTGAERRR